MNETKDEFYQLRKQLADNTLKMVQNMPSSMRREILNKEVDQYLSNGGKITEIKQGVSSGTDVGTPIHLAADYKTVKERNYMHRQAQARKRAAKVNGRRPKV